MTNCIGLHKRYDMADVSGMYVGCFKHRKDTLWFYPNGTFFQRVYDINNVLLYDGKSKWEIDEQTGCISVDSIFLSDDVDLLDSVFRSKESLTGSPNAAICFSEINQVPVLYFSIFVDLPETYIYYYMVKDFH